MKMSSVMGSLANGAVLAAIGVYFFAGERVRETPVATDRPELSPEEWHALVDGGSRIGSGMPEVVEFIDYQCTYCIRSQPYVENFVNSGRGIVIRHYPLAIHAYAEEAAKAAVCAEAQGLFREMHTELLAAADWHGGADWIVVAERVGVPDLRSFGICFDAAETMKRIERDRALAEDHAIRGTPTFVGKNGTHEGSLVSGRTLDRIVSAAAISR